VSAADRRPGPSSADQERLVEVDALHAAAIEAACDLDRAWFERHPEVRTYVRPALEHEACIPGQPCRSYALMQVCQVEPGLRARWTL
jgi:hypothetical protein